jgi:hypothetical protein
VIWIQWSQCSVEIPDRSLDIDARTVDEEVRVTTAYGNDLGAQLFACHSTEEKLAEAAALSFVQTAQSLREIGPRVAQGHSRV